MNDPSMPRFQEDDRPPKIIGTCGVCHEEIQDGYEKYCNCGNMVHDRDCTRECWICQNVACSNCITHQEYHGYVCDICLFNRNYLVNAVKDEFQLKGYWHSGTEETDDQTILEFVSGDHPKIYIHIDKVKE